MFKPGQKVICVDDSEQSSNPTIKISIDNVKKNEIYIIRDDCTTGVYLNGLVAGYWSNGKEAGFLRCRFAPIQSDSTEEEDALKNMKIEGFGTFIKEKNKELA